MAAAALFALLGSIYLWTRFRKFSIVRRLSDGKKWGSVLLPALPVGLLIVYGRVDAVNAVIVGLHLAIFWMICDALGWTISRVTGRIRGTAGRKKKEGLRGGPLQEQKPGMPREDQGILPGVSRIYWQGILALTVTAVYLGIGLYLDYNVWETDYSIFTQKDLGMETLRIVQISDSHLGTTFGGEGFAKHLKRIQETKPDLVVLTGDYVDDDSTREDMVRSCSVLGEMKTTYGVYFVFGNHDEGYFHHRDFTGQEMAEELEKNGVRVLEDETVRITDRISLTGRKDRSDPGRLSAARLMEVVDPSCYNILLDHQPHDFENEAEAGFDLVLCGHIHGGQMFPIGITGELSGANDKTYGLEKRKNTVFIVNSGISDWAIKFKTATRSEYGVIDVQHVPGSME